MPSTQQLATAADLAKVIMPSALSSVTVADQTAALIAASSIALSYIRSQFELPLLSWGDDVIDAVCAIAIYRIMKFRGYGSDAGADSTIKQSYDDAIDWLKSVALGKATPDIVDSSGGDAVSVGGVADTAYVLSGTQRGFSTRGNPNDPGGPFRGD